MPAVGTPREVMCRYIDILPESQGHNLALVVPHSVLPSPFYGYKVTRLGNKVVECHLPGLQRDEYFIAEQPAPAPHLAHPEGCAAVRIVLVTVPRVSRSREHFLDGFDVIMCILHVLSHLTITR